MDITKVTFNLLAQKAGISEDFETLDVNNDKIINEQDIANTNNSRLKSVIKTLIDIADSDETEVDNLDFSFLNNEGKTGSTGDNSIDNTNPNSLLLSIWNYSLTANDENDITDIKKTYDGKITDFYYQGTRYSIRYDENGNIIKTIKQIFDEDGKITTQEVANWKDKNKFNTIEYKYEYDDNGNRVQTERNPYYNGEEGEYIGILSKYFNVSVTIMLEPIISKAADNSYVTATDIKKTSDGRITDFVYQGVRYSVRYDEDGNVIKTLKQTFDNNNNIKTQDITNIDKNGVKIKESHTYDENGIDNTSEAQQALNRVRKLYTSKTGELSKSRDARNKFYAFLDNNTIEKLSAAGVSREDILNVFDELFPDVMNYLLNDVGDDITARWLHNKYGISYPEGMNL